MQSFLFLEFYLSDTFPPGWEAARYCCQPFYSPINPRDPANNCKRRREEKETSNSDRKWVEYTCFQ